jgi:signal transduction histidine kinase
MWDMIGSDERDTLIAGLRSELAREQGKLRALQDIGQALGNTLDVEELVTVLLTRVSRIMDSERSTLFVVDENTSELWTRFSHAGHSHEIRLKPGQGLAGWTAKWGRTVNVKDAYQDVRFDAEWDKRTGFRTRSSLCVPVRNHSGSTIGVLQVLNKRAGYFTLDDEGMLSALAGQVGVSLENSKLFLSVVSKNMELLETKEQLEQKVRELDVLFEIAQVSASARRLDDLLEGVLARAMRAIDAEAGAILLADQRTGGLVFRCAIGGDADAVKQLRIGPEEGICGWVAVHGHPQVVNDVSKDQRHSTTIADRVGYHPHSVLCVPLALEEGAGAIELLNKSQGRADFTQDDLKLASVIAGHVATAIGLAQARERREREERLTTIGQLLSGLVHDLRGPMTVISGYARYLRDEPEAERREEQSAAILRQVEAINSMAREILAFARGEENLLVRKVYLKPFFSELAETLRVELEGSGIQLGLEIEDRGVAYFDQHKIRRAVHNLVRNAVQAIGPDTGHITIGVSRRESDHTLVLTCKDDGPGVPDEIRERIFESFTSHGKPEGTGLGLAIVQKVAGDHGGTVDVKSRPGETVFTIMLPQDRAHDTLPPPGRSPSSTSTAAATATSRAPRDGAEVGPS